jgi:hypothetical protein
LNIDWFIDIESDFELGSQTSVFLVAVQKGYLEGVGSRGSIAGDGVSKAEFNGISRGVGLLKGNKFTHDSNNAILDFDADSGEFGVSSGSSELDSLILTTSMVLSPVLVGAESKVSFSIFHCPSPQLSKDQGTDRASRWMDKAESEQMRAKIKNICLFMFY